MKQVLIFLSLPALALTLLFSCQKGKPADESQTSPLITITEQGNITVPFDAGSFSIHYTITSPVDGGRIVPQSTAEWITDYDTDTDGTLTFSVTDNNTGENRSTVLTLRYVYEGGETSAQANIIQENCPYSYMTEVSYAFGYYYGDRMTTYHRYYTWLAESPLDDNMNTGDGLSYLFDIYTDKAPDNSDEPAPPAGTYTLSESNGPWTFGKQDSRVFNNSPEGASAAYFTEGTLVVTHEGGTYTCEAILTDTNGEKHRVRYSGPISLTDYSKGSYISTLTEDYNADLTGATCAAMYYSDCYMSGTSNWIITLSPLPYSKDGDYFQLDICAPASSNVETGIPAGRYAILDCDYGEYTALLGFITGYVKYGSWFWLMDNAQQGDLIAPLTNGYIDIAVNDGIYTITINATDDAITENTITATWSGEITLQDMSQ